ncbi:hypothetical protein [Nonomuraea sp. bgisy101]|uniref:hypothetical protein n=1 Tax=Nonomuraea sp. bgisy101 TaxID=3413784 RepID=UPI003D71F24E
MKADSFWGQMLAALARQPSPSIAPIVEPVGPTDAELSALHRQELKAARARVAELERRCARLRSENDSMRLQLEFDDGIKGVLARWEEHGLTDHHATGTREQLLRERATNHVLATELDRLTKAQIGRERW